MTKIRSSKDQSGFINNPGLKPHLSIGKIGIVSRDYQIKYPNGYRDFSHSFLQTLKLLDDEGCDTVLFSLFSIIARKKYDCRAALSGLKTVKAVFVEEFQDGGNRKPGQYVIYHRSSSEWKEYNLGQVFGSITGLSQQKIQHFVQDEMPKRILGNGCVLLCGETNGVKYSKFDKEIHDTFQILKSIPDNVNVILNPVHDRMTRFEMKLKRQFLSNNNRWVISVWNKGKQDKNGKTKDGNKPAWTVFYNGIELNVASFQNDLGVEIGILNIK